MKKSEMIKLMIDKAREWDDTIRDDAYEYIMPAILDAQLKAGMLPPTRNADQKSSYGYARINEWSEESL